MAVPVSTERSFSIGTPKKLFAHLGGYDVSADGQRFLVAEPAEDAPEPMVRIVQNWYEEFRDRR